MSETSTPIIPQMDDICALCGLKRFDHGDAQHEFSQDGRLIGKAETPSPQKAPPRLREQDADREQLIGDMQKSMEINAVLRLTEVLIEKGVIDSKDTMFIFSGHRIP